MMKRRRLGEAGQKAEDKEIHSLGHHTPFLTTVTGLGMQEYIPSWPPAAS